MKDHEPELVFDRVIGGYKLVCKKCGKLLWWSDDSNPCTPPPPTLGINVKDGVGTKDKFGR